MSGVLRLIGGGLIALVCAYAGVLVKKRYKLREKFYADLRDYFLFFERELTFKKTPLPEINRKYLAQSSGELSAYLDPERTGRGAKSEPLFLKKEERAQVEEALNGLGKSAYLEQVAYVKRWQAEFKDKADKCQAENKKYGGMYFKLCVLLGIALLILLA
ncbi:MAG: stage III sporulation protein AB [Clostridia bacterium]|nr:stage III sporulation protein AB [Clostridia bacterium]